MSYNSGVWHRAANFFLPNLQNWARNLNSHLLMQIKNSLLPHTHKYNHEALKKSQVREYDSLTLWLPRVFSEYHGQI